MQSHKRVCVKSEMGSEKFQVGDYVFAKVKSFPEWPAKIYAFINKKYHVYYYGTYETGVVKEKALFKFPDCRELFVTEARLNRAKFRTAVQEIDAALAGNDLAPPDLLTWAAPRKIEEMNAKVQNTAITTRLGVKQELPTTFAATLQQATQTDSAGEVNADNLATETSGKAAIRKGRKPKVSRKLKHSTATTCGKPTLAVYPSFKPKIRKWHNILLCFVYPKTFLAIKKDFGKPESFDSLQEEYEWQFKAESEARMLKNELESGLVKPHAVLHRVYLNPPKKRIPHAYFMRFHADALQKDLFLRSERKLRKLCAEIRESLRLERADVDRALELLMDVKELRLSQVMLLRNPFCVEVICRICLYEGNLEEWNLDPKEELTFKFKARLIRAEAYSLYLKFRGIFGLTDSSFFYERFRKHVSAYKQLTRSCLPEQEYALTDATYRRHAAIIMGEKTAESMAQAVEVRDGEEIEEFFVEEIEERVGEEIEGFIVDEIMECENEDTVEYGQDNEWEPGDSDEENENRADSQVADAKKTNFIIT